MFKATRLEQIALDLYDAGVIDIFKGINGSNPMSLDGASTSKLWLKAYDNPPTGGEDDTHGQLLAYVSGDATNENNWSELTPALFAVHLSGFLGSFQPLDADLTAIAGLSPSNDDIIQRKTGAWTNRTMAQLIADLAALGTTFQPLDSDLTSWAGVTRASGFDTFATTPSSANLKSLVTDETGSGGALVFATGPTIASPTLTTSPTAAGATWTDLGAVTTADINGGTIDGTIIGGSSAAAGTFTTLTATTIELGNTDTTLARSGAGVVTIEGVEVTTNAGTQTLSNKTLTAPKIANGGFIADANGNEEIIFTTTASAVNELTVANAATGGNPSMAATGGDSNIGIDFQAKGSGVYNFKSTSSQASEIRLFEDTDDGAHYTAFKPQAQAANITYTLPPNDGDATNVLTTDGSGSLSWAAAGAGDVTAASTFGTDNSIIRADGTSKGVQSSALTIADTSGTIAGFANASSLNDSSGNELVKWAVTASAVNEVTVTNAGTGNAPSMAATGGDTNITLQLKGKGTGGAAILGTSTNDSAAAGYVGEILTAVGSSTSLTTATAANVTNASITLTPGDWLVYGSIEHNGSGATTHTQIIGSLSATSATNNLSAHFNFRARIASSVDLIYTSGIGPARVSVASNTTYYLVAYAVFSGGAATALGNISAVRIR